MVRRITIAVGLLILVGGFQNCAETRFSPTEATGDLSNKGALTAMDISSDDLADGSGATETGDASGSISQTGDHHGHGQPHHDDGTCDDHDNDKDHDTDNDHDDGGGLVACILVDHGKSLKLGFVDDSLSGVNAVSKSACVSRHACLEIVPKLFEVEGAYDRGYCGHNPNVARLSDEQVQNLVDQALSPTQ